MVSPVPDLVLDHARHLRLSPLSVCDMTLRSRSTRGLDLLAAMATDGRLDRTTLIEAMRDVAASGSTAQAPAVDEYTLACLGRALLGWADEPDALRDAADLFQALRVMRPTTTMKDAVIRRGHFDRFDVQTNLQLGRTAYVDGIVDELFDDGDLVWMARTELAHPELGLPGSTWDGWLASFNQLTAAFGVAPVEIAPGDGAPFDRVGAAATPASDAADGPLVTVVMAVYSPDQSLFTSLRSILAQTWTNLEILMVDDCSPAEYQPLLEQAAALDDRVTLHRMPVNGGTYRIRNLALEIARGDVMTFQDSDDWSHPERIERQVRALLADRDLVATFSRSVRVTSGLSLNKIGHAPTRRNLSSLMIWRDQAVERLGSFDETRKSGDSEFLDRLTVVFGEERVRLLEEPLALYQLTDGSLSRADFALGWRDHDRVAYRQAFEHWHRMIADGEESPRLEPGRRRFPAPAGHLGRPGEAAPVDVAVVSDWRAGISRPAGVADEVAAIAASGRTVTVLQAELMRHAHRRRVEPSDDIWALRFAGVVEESRWDAGISAGLVVVRDPELMSYPRPLDSVRVRAGRLVVHAEIGPTAPSGDWLVYDPTIVERTAAEMFGVAPSWLPATAQIAAALRQHGAAAEILDPAPLAHVPVVRPHPDAWPSRPVVGTSGLDRLLRDRLSADQLFDLLPRTDRYDVRIRDTDQALDTRTAPRPLPATWSRRDDQPLAELLDDLDVYVCFERPSTGPERPHEALLAIAHGCVVVAPPTLRQHLGEAAVYRDGRPVAQLLDELADRPDAVAAHRDRARAWLERTASSDALLRALGLDA